MSFRGVLVLANGSMRPLSVRDVAVTETSKWWGPTMGRTLAVAGNATESDRIETNVKLDM